MRNNPTFFLLTVVLVFSSCSRSFELQPVGNEIYELDEKKFISSVDNKQPLSMHIAYTGQTKSMIGFEVQFVNTSNRTIQIQPTDFYFSATKKMDRVYALEPERILETIDKHIEKEQSKKVLWSYGVLASFLRANAEIENSPMSFEVSTGEIYNSWLDVDTQELLANLYLDYKDFLDYELLRTSNLKPGERVIGRVYFSKNGKKKLRHTELNYKTEHVDLDFSFDRVKIK